MKVHAITSRIVDAAYRAVLDPPSWQDVVGPIVAVSGSVTCGLHAVDAIRERVHHIGVGNCEPDAIAAYAEYFWARNSYNPIIARAAYGTPFHPTEREIDELVVPSEFHHDWLKPNGVGLAGTAIVLRGTRGGRIEIRINYPRDGRAEFDDLFGRSLADAAPHLARAVDLSIRTSAAAFQAGAATAVATSPVPTLVVGARATVLSANAAAEALLADGPLFLDRKGRLRAKVTRDDEAVLASMADVVKGNAAPALLRVRDFGTVGDVLLSFVPLALESDEAVRWLALLDEDAPVAVVYLSADGVGCDRLEAALADVFTLDAAEAALAVALSRGQRLETFAVARGIGTYQASLMRDRLMDRLGAHRTADVVRKVAGLARVIAAPPRPPGF